MSLDDLDMREMFDLKERLAKVIVLGPWKKTESGWERPEAGSVCESVCIWLHPGPDDRTRGWYYVIDGGVFGVRGTYTNTNHPFDSLEACKQACDEKLKAADGVILVE